VFDGRFRTSVARGVDPVGSYLQRVGVSADHLTAAGLLLAGGCAVAIGSGHLGLGLLLLIASALPDLLDGAVAKASGTASPRGAFFDSVTDRVTDTLVLGGIAWYLASAHGGHAALLPFAVLGSSTLISYERAKAESLGFVARGGLMERAERIIALCVGLAFSVVLVPVLWIMLSLTLLTAVQRFVKVWRQAGSTSSAEGAVRDMESGRLGAAARWREWRATAEPWMTRTERREASAFTWRRSGARSSPNAAAGRWRERQSRRRSGHGR
jgi:CDP-diacylglycerol--glycerol-3-phosphate 3-phosphatidyltransferase